MRPYPFVVISSQRTGSTLLTRSLDSAPQVFCAGELFHDGPRVHHGEFRYPQRVAGSRTLARVMNRAFHRQRIDGHLRRFYTHAGADKGARAVGFKIMISQLRRYPAVMPFLRKEGVCRFYLVRRDTFSTALSQLRARTSGIYHSDRANRHDSAQSITADIGEFRGLVASCEAAKQETYALHAAQGGHMLVYEDMVAAWNEFISAMGVAIGIPGLQVEEKLNKVGTSTAAIRIANEAELRNQFDPQGRG